MKCPHCGQEIQFAEICPHCGNKISYGGNTVLYKATRSGKLTYREIFSGVFRRHSQQDALRALGAGPSQGTDMLKRWQKPWMFLRLLVFLAVMAVLLYTQLNAKNLTDTTFTFSLLTSLIVPFTVALLVWEMDMHRNVTILDFLALLFLGGLITVTAAGPVNTRVLIWIARLGDSFSMDQYVSALNKFAWIASFTEESIKLLACIGFILIAQTHKRFHCLDGLAIGAAVGAGFAFWENFSYALEGSGSIGIAQYAISRTTWGLFGSHMLYTAPYVGALCLAMNGNKLKGKHFLTPTFLLTLLFGMGCHMLNNLGFNYSSITIGSVDIYLVQVLLGVVTWAMLLYMLRRGINQALETNDVNLAVQNAYTLSHASVALMCKAGTHAGSAFALENRPIIIGRQKDECNLVLTGDAVSRKHGMLRLENGQAIYRDLGSSNGSFINGKKVAPDADTVLNRGDVLELGSGSERFEVA